MTLALLTLGLLSAPPAQAQQYPGGPGWSVTDQAGNSITQNQDGSGYPLCGTLTGSAPTLTGAYPDVFADASQPSPPINYAFSPNLWSGQYWLYTGDPCPISASVWTTANASNNVSTRGGGVEGYLPDHNSESVIGSITPTTGGTLWAIFTGQGQSVPDHIDVLLTTTVQASASVNPAPSQLLSATATATDSLNETAQASADGSGGGVPLVTGHHLLRVPVDPQTKQAQVSLGGTATATATDNLPYGTLNTNPPYVGYYSTTNGQTTATANASISAAAKIDTREVAVSCPAVDTNANGGSQYRDPALTGPVITNIRQPDGTLRGDTANYPGFSNGGIILNYTASAPGIWSAGSTYLWNSSLTGSSNSGIWPNMDIFSVGEPYGPNVQNVDNISITLHDTGDSVEAVGNYNMHFHDPYEPTSWPEDGGYPRKQTTQVDPDVPSWPTYSWQAEVNPDTGGIDSVVGGAGATTSFPFTGTETQSWHLDGGLGIPVEPVDLHFGGGYDKDITNRTSGSSPALPAPLLRGQKTWVVWRKDIKRHRGHLDIYGTHGYTNTGVWYRDEDVGTERNIYYPYANAATENAHDPDPNWNPYG